METEMMLDHASGILMHVTSLPSRYGIGEFGRPVIEWLDQLVAMRQSIWQVLPLGPTGYGDSPYQSPSAFAGNPMLIGIELLVEARWLSEREAAALMELPDGSVDFERLIPIKSALLQTAAQRFLRYSEGSPARQRFEQFCRREAAWLEDYAVFTALKERETLRPWFDWPEPWRHYSLDHLARARRALEDVVAEKKVLQFFFHEQWLTMRKEAARRRLWILGDIPIFVAHDSAEVWSDRTLFQLNGDGDPTVVAGVPPDYFSATGQRWGNPLYDWPVHQRSGFEWWAKRLGRAMDLYDWVRVDHFRGFVDYWEIPADEPLATRGCWRPSPGRELFESMRQRFGDGLNIVAEDLGVLSEEVTALREAFGFPGMRILQFAFGTDPGAPAFLPEVYVRNTVAYTGTHDNDTVVSWFHEQHAFAGAMRKGEAGLHEAPGPPRKGDPLGDDRSAVAFKGWRGGVSTAGRSGPGQRGPHERPGHHHGQLALAAETGSTHGGNPGPAGRADPGYRSEAGWSDIHMNWTLMDCTRRSRGRGKRHCFGRSAPIPKAAWRFASRHSPHGSWIQRTFDRWMSSLSMNREGTASNLEYQMRHQPI